MEQVGGPEVGLIARQRQAGGAVGLAFEIRRGVERQQHRHRTASDPGEEAALTAFSCTSAGMVRGSYAGTRRWPANVKREAIAGRVLISVRS